MTLGTCCVNKDVFDAGGPVLFWREGAVAHIRFNRPHALNAIDLATACRFLSSCRRIAEDGAVPVLVISGNGRALMAGGDLAAISKVSMKVR